MVSAHRPPLSASRGWNGRAAGNCCRRQSIPRRLCVPASRLLRRERSWFAAANKRIAHSLSAPHLSRERKEGSNYLASERANGWHAAGGALIITLFSLIIESRARAFARRRSRILSTSRMCQMEGKKRRTSANERILPTPEHCGHSRARCLLVIHWLPATR